MAVRLLPQVVSEVSEDERAGGVDEHKASPATQAPANSSDLGDTRGSASGDGGVFRKGCLPAFRFEREGLAFDEYHTHGDVPYEGELAKRVKAALSLARPEDTGELRFTFFSYLTCALLRFALFALLFALLCTHAVVVTARSAEVSRLVPS